MSTRPKAFLKQAKPKQKKEQKLDDADDYQAAGVDFEDAAGKWRAGDPVKSMRFFHRALDVYEQGLLRFPESLDLAYNKARVQLEVATHPLLVRHVQVPLIHALQQALESHRYALQLDNDNPDALFNTAQVLTSIAEVLAGDDVHDDSDAIEPLAEALELQSKCLSLQQQKYDNNNLAENQTGSSPLSLDNESDDEDGGVAVAPVSSATQEDQWFSVVEPVTKRTLVDTILAQLNTLTTLCSILSSLPATASPTMLTQVEDLSTDLLVNKLPQYAEGSEPEDLQEIALAIANFKTSFLEAAFRYGKIDLPTYRTQREALYVVPELHLDRNTQALLSNARSQISMATAIADLVDISDSSARIIANNIRWNCLSGAISSLATASKIPQNASEDQIQTHLLRGDASLLQFTMSQPPNVHQPALTNAAQLLKNAEVFYRNASKLSSDPEEQKIARLRSALATGMQSEDRAMRSNSVVQVTVGELTREKGEAWLQHHVEDMVLEGLLSRQIASQL